MMMVDVIEAPKERFSWIAPLRKLDRVKKPIYFWYADRMKVAPLISKDIKYEFPEREYETVKEVINGREYLKVWRNK